MGAFRKDKIKKRPSQFIGLIIQLFCSYFG
uniref:Uncharacterized protein n=1 Tax=Siphoviridae sp. ctBCr48 TaxID=2827802 RepID=A0A8S5SH13_9CAUD|nr:MAG TPA: hypothetical protein [Siphoviridae sp. ctBCr48]